MLANVRRGPEDFGGPPRRWSIPALAAFAILPAIIAVVWIYGACKIEVATGKQAVLIRKTGRDLEPDQLIAPPSDGKGYVKGVQPGVLTEGRYFYNPLYWDWEIQDQQEVPNGKIGLRIAQVGADLPAGQILADEGQKGIRREVLKPGRYPYNWYAETIVLADPVTVPAGFQGVVTNLAGPLPKDPNVVLVGKGERGVEKETLTTGTKLLNPYEKRVSLVDCRSKRFNLGQGYDMDFLSADGFPVTIDGAIEFRVIPSRAAEVFVLYNEDANGDEIGEEIVRKIITPISRSICRIGGSKLSGGQFISGIDKEQFQQDLVRTMTEDCKKQGIEILAVAITSITPPEAIALPVRQREVAKQQLQEYQQERLQQLAEAQLRVQNLLSDQKQAMVEAEQSVVEQTTRAEQDLAVARTLAEQKLAVTGTEFEAVKAKAGAVIAGAQADADVLRAKNKAELAGLASRVRAFGGDGSAMAQNILISKLAPSYHSILTNSDGPLMELFGQFSGSKPKSTPSPSPAAVSTALPPNPFANAEASKR